VTEEENRCPVCKQAVPPQGDEKHGSIAGFRSDSYLNDPRCQQLLIGISRDWRQHASRSSLSRYPIAEFHPVSTDELKQARDFDAYFVTVDCVGTLVRTHTIKAEGAIFLNPPPSDHHCESCHKLAGPLRKAFKNSRIDNAVVPAWLCSACEVLDPRLMDLRS
jgi:hypothetical protein